MIKNLASYKTRVFFGKVFFMFTAFTEKAVYYTYENTPRTSVTDELSTPPTSVLITVTQGAKCHTEITFLV